MMVTIDDEYFTIRIDGPNCHIQRKTAGTQQMPDGAADLSRQAKEPDVLANDATNAESSEDRRRRQNRERQQRYRNAQRNANSVTVTHNVTQSNVTVTQDNVTERYEDIVCLTDCNINNINLNKQSSNQARSNVPMVRSVTRTVTRNAECDMRNAERDMRNGQLRLALTYNDPRPELSADSIKDGYRRWVEMRQSHRYYNISEINHLDFLNQLAAVVRDHGVDEGLRWIQLQIDNERLNVPDKYQPPPPADEEQPDIIYGPGCAPPVITPAPELTPEQEAARAAQEEAFFRRLGGKSLERYRKATIQTDDNTADSCSISPKKC